MISTDPLAKFRGYLAAKEKDLGEGVPRPSERSSCFVTISRQFGAGGHSVAFALVALLQERILGERDTPWTVFDRNLLEVVAAEHGLPEEMVRKLDQEIPPRHRSIVEELFGFGPTAETIVRRTSETILRLATLGNAIFVGRGASIVTKPLPRGLHVRLAASEKSRRDHLVSNLEVAADQAAAWRDQEDAARREHLRRFFRADIDDPLLYDLVINTDRVPYAEAAVLIADAVQRRWAGED